jgi:hypothetical protein
MMTEFDSRLLVQLLSKAHSDGRLAPATRLEARSVLGDVATDLLNLTAPEVVDLIKPGKPNELAKLFGFEVMAAQVELDEAFRALRDICTRPQDFTPAERELATRRVQLAEGGLLWLNKFLERLVAVELLDPTVVNVPWATDDRKFAEELFCRLKELIR